MKFSMKLERNCYWPKPHQLLHSIFLSFIGLWLKLWHRNKNCYKISCSKLNPVQRSRSKLTTCPRKGHLLRFKSSTVTSNGCSQKLRHDIWCDSELIATKVCSWICLKWNATCPRKGHLLRFESIIIATSDGGAQKLGNNVWHDSESIATKACSQIGCKWNAMFESHVEN